MYLYNMLDKMLHNTLHNLVLSNICYVSWTCLVAPAGLAGWIKMYVDLLPLTSRQIVYQNISWKSVMTKKIGLSSIARVIYH